MDLSQKITTLAQHGTTWILWLLIALSVTAIAIVLERAVLFWSSRDDIGKLRRELRQLLSRGQTEAAQKMLERSPSYEARIASVGLEVEASASAEERMRAEGEMVRLRMEQNLSFLGTLGNNAPFVGLLGTVIGIVRAFRELEHSQGRVSAALMTEVGEALVATAVGLLIALPAVAFFNLFQRLIRARISRAEALIREILAFYKSPAATFTPGE
ncbi:MAG: MotA/TolQ/ExbB proton channel family protein [Myxococcota bacterium]|nr:MotA/TolQ/ExbB proton channel family protein [Myxococcota bacterium]